MIRKKLKNLFKKENFFYFVSLPILLVIRYQWTMVSQFREDQSTNLWLAYKYDIFDTPVGLLSSKMIPQPNGVIVFGKILTIFHSALSSTLFYSLLQVILFYFLVKEITDRPELQKFFFSLLSLSMLMGSSSVEFWNQWTLVQINTLFFIFFFKYLNSPSSNLLLVNICIASQVDINSDNEVSISYFLNGLWGGIPEHSEVFSEWYPEYPFTIGRFFDYQLLNNHSIINSLEGKNFRDYSDSQFIVSYSFDEVKFLDNTLYEHFYIDRLRVSIRTENK
jgi:hypothetical protein